MQRECWCVVCDKGFERSIIKGRHAERYRLCDDCVGYHKWCPWRRHAPLKSRFSRSTHAPSGYQPYCNDCLPDQRGNIKILKCAHCLVEFRPDSVNKHRFNGSAVNFCDDCYPNVKHCNRCSAIKPLTDFNSSSGKATGRGAHCKQCSQEKWHAKPFVERFQGRRRGFEITHDDWLAMRAAQNDLCAICGEPETAVRTGKVMPLSIDHCHVTNQVRELLCHRCNKAIGLMLDDPVRLRAAADYVERWAKVLAAAPTG